MRTVPPENRAFSLVEVLAVVAIICLITLISSSALNGTVSSYRLATGADAIAGRLESARLLAASKNQAVQFRIIRPSGEDWQYYQLLIEDERTGATRVYGSVGRLPEGTSFLTNTDNGGILTLPLQTIPTGQRFSGADFVGIRFSPGGQVKALSLSSNNPFHTNTPMLGSSNNFLTLAARRNGATELPPNWVAIKVDSKTGAVTRFQP
jgi:prepilin-type N-terminal cleavage/methylation domain-containing protein